MVERTIPTLSTPSEVPTGANIAYHVSPSRNRDSILRRGIRPRDRGPKGTEVDSVLHEYDADFTDIPENRSECVFLHPTTGTPLDAAQGTCICFVVDLTRINNPMYTADWLLLGDLYGSPDADAERAAAEAYWESCRSYQAGEHAESEIIVEGGVPVEAITHVFQREG